MAFKRESYSDEGTIHYTPQPEEAHPWLCWAEIHRNPKGSLELEIHLKEDGEAGYDAGQVATARQRLEGLEGLFGLQWEKSGSTENGFAFDASPASNVHDALSQSGIPAEIQTEIMKDLVDLTPARGGRGESGPSRNVRGR